MIRSACRFSDRRVALSWMMLDTMSCPCLGWTPPLSDRSSSVHMTQRTCSPRAVWLVHLLDSVLMLSSVGENVQRRILRRALARGTIFFLLNFFGSRKKRRHVTWATREGGKSQTQLRWLSQARAAAGGFTQAPGPRAGPKLESVVFPAFDVHGARARLKSPKTDIFGHKFCQSMTYHDRLRFQSPR